MFQVAIPVAELDQMGGHWILEVDPQMVVAAEGVLVVLQYNSAAERMGWMLGAPLHWRWRASWGVAAQ